MIDLWIGQLAEYPSICAKHYFSRTTIGGEYFAELSKKKNTLDLEARPMGILSAIESLESYSYTWLRASSQFNNAPILDAYSGNIYYLRIFSFYNRGSPLAST